MLNEMIEIEACLLSGECKLLEVHRNTNPWQVRKMLRQTWNTPFITILDQGGDILDFELPIAWQVSPVLGRIELQAMAQQPILTCNRNTAVLWCPNNPFLCAIGSEYSGNCIDKTGTPYPRPIRQVFAGTNWFLAVRTDGSMMTWGHSRPQILRREIPRKGRLQSVLAPTDDIVALLWEESRLDVWDDRQRAGNPEPLHSWDTVTKVKANEHAIAAILADGRVMAYGVQCGGGTLPDLVNQKTSKWLAVELYAARYAFLVTLSNGTAIIWGSVQENGPLPTQPAVVEKHGCEVVNVSSTSYAFAITWSDGSVTTIGDPDGGGNSSHVQGLLTSVQLVRSSLRAFAAVTSHRNVVCWGDPKWGSNGSNTCMRNCGHHKHKWLICSPHQTRGRTELGCVQALWAPPFEDTPQCGTDTGHGWCFCCLAPRGHRNNMGQPELGREHQACAERGIRNTVAHSQLNNVYCRKGRPCGRILGIPHRNPHTMLRPSRRAKMSRR